VKERLKKIEDAFTALKTDVMISETDLEKQKKRLAELGKQETRAKESLRQEYGDLKNSLVEAKDWARILKVKPNVALLLLNYRELKQIHWHIDQMMDSQSNR